MRIRGFLAIGLSLACLGAFAACETANDPDEEDATTDVTDVTDAKDDPDSAGNEATEHGGSGSACVDFCEDMVAACPEDDTLETCLESCEHADNEPGTTALECAAAAMDCTAARACWSQLYVTP